MTEHDLIELFFGGMAKLGPGGDEHTVSVLSLLPVRKFGVVVDAGCGTGRQTLVLARELGTTVHAVDSHGPFLRFLERRAEEAGMADLVRTHHMDMKHIPGVFPHIDLLWSEAAAYSIGFSDALRTWRSSIHPGGFAVVSELSWLRGRAPRAAREFFLSEYPDMQSVERNIERAREAGYALLATHRLPRDAWVDGYYEVLAPRAKALLDHPDPSVRDFASQTVREIDIFDRSEDSFGYVFFVLRR